MSRGPGAADGIGVWNLEDGGTSVAGAQETFPILGRVREPASVTALTYSLNGSDQRPVVFHDGANRSPNRLTSPGDFSIDTVSTAALRPDNVLHLTATRRDGRAWSRRLSFSVRHLRPAAEVRVDPGAVRRVEEAGQVVDGRWRRDVDDRGRPCLSIAPADAGLDRVVLFTAPVTAPAYTLLARMRVARWMRGLHNLGLVFAWRGHEPGDGTVLPSTWTTGLGYYYSHCPGLRLRVGEQVRYDNRGRKVGDTVLAEAPLSRPRAALARATRRLAGGTALRQLRPGTDYWFRLRVTPERYLLAVWQAGRPEPAPQVVARPPCPRPAPGAAGVIAHYCAVNVYEYRYEVQRPEGSG